MSEDDGDTGAEARVAELLAELRESQPPGGQLVPRVTRSVRWQRPLRRALEGIGALGGAFGSGLAALVRGGRGSR
jgi:hypothetical protein